MPRENQLIVSSEISNEIACLTLDGELIAETRFEAERILRDWMEDGIRNVVVRCHRLSHIDSAGFSTLLGALHRLRRSGGDLILANLNPSLNAIFEITSMQRYFKIFNSLEEAKAHFAQVSLQPPRHTPPPEPPKGEE